MAEFKGERSPAVKEKASIPLAAIGDVERREDTANIGDKLNLSSSSSILSFGLNDNLRIAKCVLHTISSNATSYFLQSCAAAPYGQSVIIFGNPTELSPSALSTPLLPAGGGLQTLENRLEFEHPVTYCSNVDTKVVVWWG